MQYRIKPNLHISQSVLSRYLANSPGSTIIFFFIAAIIIRWFGQIVALPSWTWLLLRLRYCFIDNRISWFLLSSSSFSSKFSALFCCNKFMNLSFTETFALSWELFLGLSLNFLRDSMGNSYRKKDYSKGEVNIVEIIQIRLQKMKKNVAMASFCFVWSVKFGKK